MEHQRYDAPIRVIRTGYSLTEKYGSVIKNFGIEELLRERLFDGNGHDIGTAQGGHVTELLFPNQFDRFEPEASGQYPVIRGGGSPTLDVPEDRYASFDSGSSFDLVAEPVTDALRVVRGQIHRSGRPW